jgi:hypothetical protein
VHAFIFSLIQRLARQQVRLISRIGSLLVGLVGASFRNFRAIQLTLLASGEGQVWGCWPAAEDGLARTLQMLSEALDKSQLKAPH